MILNGYQVIVSEYVGLERQVRFPRSKRRRIRAKWAKRRRNFRIAPAGYVFINHKDRTIMAHPADWRGIERELNRMQSNSVSALGRFDIH